MQLSERIALDARMPNMDGCEMLLRWSREGNWIPILLPTRIGETCKCILALKKGADDDL